MTIWGISDRRADARARTDRPPHRLRGQRADALRSGDPAGRQREPRLHDVPRARHPEGRRPVEGRAGHRARRWKARPAHRTSRNLLYFKKTKDLQLPKPEIKLAVAAGANGALAVSVGAKQLAPQRLPGQRRHRRVLRRQLLRRPARRDRDRHVPAAQPRRRRPPCRPRSPPPPSPIRIEAAALGARRKWRYKAGRSSPPQEEFP